LLFGEFWIVFSAKRLCETAKAGLGSLNGRITEAPFLTDIMVHLTLSISHPSFIPSLVLSHLALDFSNNNNYLLPKKAREDI